MFTGEYRHTVDDKGRIAVPVKFRAQVEELFALMQAGKIDPLVSETFPLERAGDAIAKLENREAVGKLVVTMA